MLHAGALGQGQPQGDAQAVGPATPVALDSGPSPGPVTLNPMKGLVLAGGTATRLFPLTIVTNKHLLPIYDRPMIYYPLDTLAGMGIREVMVIVGGKSVGDIVELLGDGRHFGLDLTYRYQRGALGIAHAIGLARDFIGGDAFCVVLGDNILRGEPLAETVQTFEDGPYGAGTLLYRVPDPERFGVAELDEEGRVVGFEEKPEQPKSTIVSTGVYVMPKKVVGMVSQYVREGNSADRFGDFLVWLMNRHNLHAFHFDKWFDIGTPETYARANEEFARA